MALKSWCKVPLTYGEKVETIVIGTQVGRGRLDDALKELDETKNELGASEFCLSLGEGHPRQGGVVREDMTTKVDRSIAHVRRARGAREPWPPTPAPSPIRRARR